jgi:PAS domain S-box-containing protein
VDSRALTAADLAQRPSRAPDYKLENEALLALTDAVARRSEDILQTLCEHAMHVCDAGSAGISMLVAGRDRSADQFTWTTIVGELAHHVGGGLSFDASPCGQVITRNVSLLFDDPQSHFPATADLQPRVFQALLAPFHVDKQPIGTVWVLSHSPQRQFDREDQRRLVSLSHFAAAAHQLRVADASLKEAQRRVQLTLSNSQIVGLWEWDVRADMVRADARFAEMFNVDHAVAARGAPVGEFLKAIHTDDLDRVAEQIQHSVATGDSFVCEYRIVRKATGNIHYVLARGQPELDDSGVTVRFPGIIVDLTEQRQAEVDFSVSERQFRALAQTLPNLVWTATPRGEVNWLNDRMYSYTGKALGSLEGDRWVGCIHPEDQPNARARWSASLRSGESYEVQFRFRRVDGVYRWHRANAVAVEDAEGRIVRWVGGMTDIEEQRGQK